MMSENNRFDTLETQADGLNETLASTSVLVSGFDSELRRMRLSLAATGKDLSTFEKGLSKGLRSAFNSVVFDGMKLSDAMRSVSQALSKTAFNAAVRPVTDHVSGMVTQGVSNFVQGILPFAHGAPFSQGKVMPFAQGGVVSGATYFGMRGGLGVMGEAGPEAIMPLSRGPDGKLGVKAGGATAPINVVMNISTPDAQSFQRSQSQIAAQMSRALSAGARNR